MSFKIASPVVFLLMLYMIWHHQWHTLNLLALSVIVSWIEPQKETPIVKAQDSHAANQT